MMLAINQRLHDSYFTKAIYQGWQSIKHKLHHLTLNKVQSNTKYFDENSFIGKRIHQKKRILENQALSSSESKIRIFLSYFFIIIGILLVRLSYGITYVFAKLFKEILQKDKAINLLVKFKRQFYVSKIKAFSFLIRIKGILVKRLKSNQYGSALLNITSHSWFLNGLQLLKSLIKKLYISILPLIKSSYSWFSQSKTHKYLKPVLESIDSIYMEMIKLEQNLIKIQMAKQMIDWEIIQKTQIQKVILSQDQQLKITSNIALKSYFEKYNNFTDKKQVYDKFMNHFEILKQTTENGLESTMMLTQCVKQKICLIKEIKFSPCLNQQKIKGNIILFNNNKQKLTIQIPKGQLFAPCNQTICPVLVKQLIIEVPPEQEVTINLQGFCGDSCLNWPEESTDFVLTSFKMVNFIDDQLKIWRQIDENE